MTILKIIEALQSYGEDVLAYKLDGGFANAVTEAVSLLIGQGEQIADLQNELRDERYRHDRYVDFELAEAEELRKAREAQRWIPVTERLPEEFSSVIVYRKTKTYSMLHYSSALGFHFYDSEWGDVTVDNVTHWMPLPEPPKEVAHDE